MPQLFFAEYGADSYDHSVGAENQPMQAAFDAQLWDEVFFDLSAERTSGAVLGALIMEFSDSNKPTYSASSSAATSRPGSGAA